MVARATGPGAAAGLEDRLAASEPDLYATLVRVYGYAAARDVTDRLVVIARAAHAARPAGLRTSMSGACGSRTGSSGHR